MTNELHDRLDRLTQGCTGQIPTALPEVWAVRLDETADFARNFSRQTHVSMALSGVKQVSTGGFSAENTASRLLVLRGGRSYQARVLAQPDNPYLALKIQFPPRLLAQVLLDMQDAGSGADAQNKVASPLFSTPVDDQAHQLANQLLQAIENPVDRRIVAPLRLKELALRLMQAEAGQSLRAGLRREHQFVVEAMRFIDENYARPIALSDLAERFAASPSHFSRRFREVAGIAPLQYHKQARLRAARELLVGEGARVEQAAHEVGYESASQFSRDFTREFGLSPARYGAAFRDRA